jgi:hypothetical protein
LQVRKAQRKFWKKSGTVPKPFWDFLAHLGMLRKQDIPLRESRSLTTLVRVLKEPRTDEQRRLYAELAKEHSHQAKRTFDAQKNYAQRLIYRRPVHPWPTRYDQRRPIKTVLIER